VFGLSGYFAMQVAYLMGCQPIVLCGCPGEPMARLFEAEARTDFGYGAGTSENDRGIQRQLMAEMERVLEFKARIQSCSGWTKAYFGGLGT
jgi:hypothetical protein